MEMLGIKCFLFALVVTVASSMPAGEKRTCINKKSPCFLKQFKCPPECPSTAPKDTKSKVCYIDCNSPICKAKCKRRKPNCNGPGAVCLDPRFIGGDGIVFYFHGKRDEHFSLVSDVNFQINARFIGLRPAGRARDYTWIQALGFLFGPKTFTLEATHAANWDDGVDHLKLTYNEEEIIVPKGHLSRWEPTDSELIVERISDTNSVLITLSDFAEISVSVVLVPITKEYDKIHNYQIPEDNCFAHLEVQFKFYALSPNVEGVLGMTYQPDFKNPAKPRVAMPVVGGEDKYRTSSILSAECSYCTYSPNADRDQEDVHTIMDRGTLDCAAMTGASLLLVVISASTIHIWMRAAVAADVRRLEGSRVSTHSKFVEFWAMLWALFYYYCAKFYPAHALYAT